MSMPDHVSKNRAYWNSISAEYQRTHGAKLEKEELAWGVWAVPERELRILGDVTNKDVLEFGCGGAQWSVALARRGSRVTGLDLSEEQLQHARELVARAGVHVTLVAGSAEDTPFADASFDVEDSCGQTTFQLTYGEWIRLFRRSGLVVEDLVEIRPSEGANTTYEGYAPPEFARRYPAENVWKLRREGPR